MASATRDELYQAIVSVGLTKAIELGLLDGALGEAGGAPYVLPAATLTAMGGVKKAAAVADQGALTVTDIAGAQTAVTALVAKVNAILVSQRAAGQI